VDTWSLTWSPKEDVEELPPGLRDFLESDKVSHAYAVAEYAKKWHIHVAMKTTRSYGSDYKWWKVCFKDLGMEAPALEVKYHEDIVVLAGGYAAKGVHKPLYNKGFTKELLEQGSKVYEERLQRKTITDYLATLRVINPNMVHAAMGATMALTGCKEDDAISTMSTLGMTFAQSNKLTTEQMHEVQKQHWYDFKVWMGRQLG